MKALELFAGAGGFAIGITKQVSIPHSSLKLTHGTPKLTRRIFPKLRSLLVMCDRSPLGVVALIWSTVGPRQSFSVMGRRRASDLRSSLLGEFARIVNEVKPLYFVMENVPGLTSGHQRLWLDKFLQQIPDCYHLSTSILNAADYGTPQNRRRLFVIGSLSPIVFPNPYTQKVTVREAITDLPDNVNTIHSGCNRNLM